MKTLFVRIGEWLANVWYWLKATIGGARMDANQINDQLWCGGAVTTDADVAQLDAWGITADIDCREEFDDHSLIDEYNGLPPTPNSLKLKMRYCFDGVPDDGQPKPISWFQTAWVFAKPIFDAGPLGGDGSEPGVLLCHCAAGVNRGPSMAYFLLSAHWKLSGDDAFALLKAKRPQVQVAYRISADSAITALGL